MMPEKELFSADPESESNFSNANSISYNANKPSGELVGPSVLENEGNGYVTADDGKGPCFEGGEPREPATVCPKRLHPMQSKKRVRFTKPSSVAVKCAKRDAASRYAPQIEAPQYRSEL